MRLSGTNCWISTTCTKDGDVYSTYVFCMSRMRGLKCPLDGKQGARPFELSSECFEVVHDNGAKAKKV